MVITTNMSCPVVYLNFISGIYCHPFIGWFFGDSYKYSGITVIILYIVDNPDNNIAEFLCRI